MWSDAGTHTTSPPLIGSVSTPGRAWLYMPTLIGHAGWHTCVIPRYIVTSYCLLLTFTFGSLWTSLFWLECLVSFLWKSFSCSPVFISLWSLKPHLSCVLCIDTERFTFDIVFFVEYVCWIYILKGGTENIYKMLLEIIVRRGTSEHACKTSNVFLQV